MNLNAISDIQWIVNFWNWDIMSPLPVMVCQVCHCMVHCQFKCHFPYRLGDS